jgi:type I restriction enzyme R subunit
VSEKTDVQDPMLQYANDIGWSLLTRQEALALRGGESGLFFNDLLAGMLVELNPGIVDGEQAQSILRQLRLLSADIRGNCEALGWMRGEKSVFVPAEKRERNVALIDFDNPDRNIFHVTPEWVYHGTPFTNRADVVFLINGIPVAVAETKHAGKSQGLADGVEQIRRYHRETPHMLLSPQVFEVTELINFFYGVTWNTNRKNLFNWKDEHSGNYESRVKAFFDRERFLRVLRDYIIFVTENDELSKKILRQHQTRAVEKVVERVHDPSKRRGLIWHTQGSGKTLTMITVAARLLAETDSEKPTVLMLVDRNELQGQLFQNLVSCGLASAVVAKSKRHLQQLLASDQRGLIVSMVHKFDEIPANINMRGNFVVLVDEAHRTTGGDLGNYLMAALPNATYIGFTGTPIDRISQGRGTFKVFGCEDETGYLDKYSIAESIEDGTTVPLNYAHGPSDLRIDKELLEEEFFGLAEAEGISDIDELNAVLDRAVRIKEAMKNPERMDRIAQLVAKHYAENVKPMGFKAFLVGVDREACALYKQALDKYLPPEFSRVVYSGSPNDRQLLKDYWLDEADEKQVRKDFIRRDALPKILIVTEKLLTGYDAPVLYCMYLDKPMRDHVLLQTIARVNRPYEDENGKEKPYGLVFDFVGIFENLEKALAFDSDVVTSVIKNIDVLQQLFATMMRETAPQYLPLAAGTGDKAREAAIERFVDSDEREQFYQFYRRLQSLYEILTPDAFLRDYIDDFQALTGLYGLVRQAYDGGPYVDRELTEKTKQLLRQHSHGLNFEMPGAVHELTAEVITALRGKSGSSAAKILNLSKVFAEMTERDGPAQPYLFAIGERAQAIVEAWKDRRESTQQALEDFMRLAQEYLETRDERHEIDVDENTFAIFTALKPVVETVTTAAAIEVDALFREHPDYAWSDHEKSQLRAALYKVLLPLVGKEKLMAVTATLLRLKRTGDR